MLIWTELGHKCKCSLHSAQIPELLLGDLVIEDRLQHRRLQLRLRALLQRRRRGPDVVARGLIITRQLRV